MDRRLSILMCLIVVLALLIPLGGGQGSSAAEISAIPAGNWILSGEAIAIDGALSLSSVSWSVQGISAGGFYRLESVSAPVAAGSGCCCTYLPCIYRNH